MTKANRSPGSAWFLRRDVQSYPNGYVRTTDGDLIQVVYFERDGSPQGLMLTRKDARLLAKRINQCLDGTVHR